MAQNIYRRDTRNNLLEILPNRKEIVTIEDEAKHGVMRYGQLRNIAQFLERDSGIEVRDWDTNFGKGVIGQNAFDISTSGLKFGSGALGAYSLASGLDSTASGVGSTAIGNGTTASGDGSFASGKDTTASGDGSTALGNNTTASGDGSFVVGSDAIASGDYSTAFGQNSFLSDVVFSNKTRPDTNGDNYGTYLGVLNDDELIHTTGWTDNNGYDNFNLIYTISTDTWRTAAPFPDSEGVEGAYGTVLPNGTLFFGGGDTNDDGNGGKWYIFDPVADTWTYETTMPAGAGRVKGGMCLLPNGLILAYGGMDENWDNMDPAAYTYNLTTQTWTKMGDHPNGTRSGTYLVRNGNDIFSVGGVDANNWNFYSEIIHKYNYLTDTWTEFSLLPSGGAYAVSAVNIPEKNLIILAGGVGETELYTDVYSMDTITGEIKTIGSLNEDNYGLEGVYVNGSVFYSGGDTNNFFTLDIIEEDRKTTTSGEGSFSTGGGNNSSGKFSVSLGESNVASGISSFSSGTNNNSIGTNSVTTGTKNLAQASNSFAEGSRTTASGVNSHSEGSRTTASGVNSHSEGTSTVASGVNSHSEGENSVASGTGSHAEGQNNTASGTRSHSEGYNTTASGTGSHAEGQNNTASGTGSHAEGQNNTASGNYSHAEGYGSNVSGSYSHVEGYSNNATGQSSHAEGHDTDATGSGTHAEGYQTNATGSYGSHSEGRTTNANGQSSHAEGYNSQSSGSYSHAEGYSCYAGNSGSHAEGFDTDARGAYSHSEGYSCYANGTSSHSEGQNTSSYGHYSHAEGKDSNSGGQSSHAEGESTNSSGSYSHSEGYDTDATNSGSHAEGYQTNATGNYGSHSEGRGTNATSDSAHAEGYNTRAYGSRSHAEGYNTQSSGSSSHAEGESSSSGGSYSHAEGYSTNASNSAAHAEGYDTNATGTYGAHSEGRTTTASGESSHAEGYSATASGIYSHAEGYGTIASGTSSHAEGRNTTAGGYNGAHAEGFETTASGRASHAEGDKTTASGDGGSHAEGYNTQSSGQSSHAEGRETIALNNNSHAQGQFNVGTDIENIHETGIGTADVLRKNAFEISYQGALKAPSLTKTIMKDSSDDILIAKDYFNGLPRSVVYGADPISINTQDDTTRYGYGFSIAVNDTRIAVTAQANSQGSVYIYDKSWNFINEIRTEINDESVGLEGLKFYGDRLYISHPGWTTDGEVIVTDLDGNVQFNIPSPVADKRSNFGKTVAVNSTYIAIGQDYYNNGEGLIHIFDTSGSFLRTYSMSSPSTSDRLGGSDMAMDEDTLFFVLGVNRVVGINISDGSERFNITPSVSLTGYPGLHLDNDRLYVGSGYMNSGIGIFDLDGAEVKIMDTATYFEPYGVTPLSDANFGGSISTTDDFIYIGANGNGNSTNPGEVLFFDKVSYEYRGSLYPDTVSSVHYSFGRKIVINGTDIYVGAPGDDNDPWMGNVYTFNETSFTIVSEDPGIPLFIRENGSVDMREDYEPLTPKSVATKEYVDLRETPQIIKEVADIELDLNTQINFTLEIDQDVNITRPLNARVGQSGLLIIKNTTVDTPFNLNFGSYFFNIDTNMYGMTLDLDDKFAIKTLRYEVIDENNIFIDDNGAMITPHLPLFIDGSDNTLSINPEGDYLIA